MSIFLVVVVIFPSLLYLASFFQLIALISQKISSLLFQRRQSLFFKSNQNYSLIMFSPLQIQENFIFCYFFVIVSIQSFNSLLLFSWIQNMVINSNNWLRNITKKRAYIEEKSLSRLPQLIIFFPSYEFYRKEILISTVIFLDSRDGWMEFWFGFSIDAQDFRLCRTVGP